jgi:predicted ATPase/DNA-binding CsgD family transcriptional regulator
MEGGIRLRIGNAAPTDTHAAVVPLSGTGPSVPPTPFIGREEQIAEVCSLLGRTTLHLLTLTGPGGIGKTRLAISVFEDLRREFADGAYYVPLAALTNPGLVLPAIAQAMDVHQAGASSGQAPLLERLQELIGHRHILLVLDNFEQVIDAAADLAVLLGSCPRLKLLVTSREVLRLSGEQIYPVPPLALPDLENLAPLEVLAQVEAVRLFVTRAQAAQPDFALTPANAPAVAAICHRLDGLPLAIELATARIRMLPPAQMLARLEKRLQWLTGGPRDAPARHQTLRAAIAWSYDLLTTEEQVLFRQLCVFAGGCTVEAAVAVCRLQQGEAGPQADGQAQTEEELMNALVGLIDKSLLQRGRRTSEQGRIFLLETVREFGLEQLVSAGESEQVRRSHASYFADLAELADSKMIGPEQPELLERLEEEHDNLRAALTWAAAAGGDPELGARLASSLWRFWLMRGYITEGRRWLDTLLAHGRLLPEALRADALRARVLNAAGRLALRQGDNATAASMLHQSLAIRRALGDKRGEMEVLDNLGLMAIYQDDLPEAQSYFEQSLEGWRSLNDERGMITALIRLGLALRYQGAFGRAAALYEECLEIARHLHATYFIAAALHNLGQMEHHRGNDARARALLVESLVLMQRLGNRPDIAVFLADMAGVWAAQGEPERAALLFGASQVLREKMNVIMYAAQRLAYEQDVQRGAARVDAATWEAAWERGRALSLEEAWALAVEADRAPAAGSAYDLTEREREVLRLLVAGLTYAQMADRLAISFHTVHAHLRSIYGKLDVTSRGQATRFATEHGLG